MVTSPLFSPASDRRFWSALNGRVETLLQDRNKDVSGQIPPQDVGESGRGKRLKEDSMLLLRGFDSISQTLSQLSNNLDNALQGARNLAKPPTLTEIFLSNLKNSEEEGKHEDLKQSQEEKQESQKSLKRKYDPEDCSDCQVDDSHTQKEESPKEKKMMKRAKNIAISMATKAASLARELKSKKSDLCFMQERCSLLEEENRRLRDGFGKGIRPEEDDLVRLQLEALLAEKSRLANENANLIRENQYLHQLVEYHRLTSQDLSDSYEQVIQGLCLDFSSPQPDDGGCDGDYDNDEALQTPEVKNFDLSTSLDESFKEEKEH